LVFGLRWVVGRPPPRHPCESSDRVAAGHQKNFSFQPENKIFLKGMVTLSELTHRFRQAGANPSTSSGLCRQPPPRNRKSTDRVATGQKKNFSF